MHAWIRIGSGNGSGHLNTLLGPAPLQISQLEFNKPKVECVCVEWNESRWFHW